MRRLLRFGVAVLVGGGTLAAYLATVGAGEVFSRVAGVAPAVAATVLALVVVEGLTDAIGVWASIRPLGRLSGAVSVQFALAGDFFDTLSPAGPVSSEPIMARFIGVTTGTTYTEALAVRGVAKYVKAGTQLLLSTVLVVGLLVGDPAPSVLFPTLGGAVLALGAAGTLLLFFRGAVSAAVVRLGTPVLARVSALYREPYDRAAVAAAMDRFWSRIRHFRGAPELVALIALAAVVEQVVVAGALWAALAGTGPTVALLPIVAVVPLPRASSVLPVPASLGAYDVLLAGALALVTGAPEAGAAAAVLLFRTASIPFAFAAGGVAVTFLRGWRP